VKNRCFELNTLFILRKHRNIIILLNINMFARFEFLTAMTIQVVVFLVVTPCNDVVGY
jgi:hypothetical protein